MTAKERIEEQEKVKSELDEALFKKMQEVCLRAIHMDNLLAKIRDFAKEGAKTDGGHHKQWYLYEIAKTLGADLNDVDKGVAP
jgi:hypothetical protein